jgi:hypothetical protein
VWPIRRLSCTNAKLASPHLIAPVIRGQPFGSRKRPLVPNQLLAQVVLHVGHRMRKHAAVQGVCLLAADVLPDLREQAASGLTLASVVVQLYPLAETSDRWVWLDQRRLLHRLIPRR